MELTVSLLPATGYAFILIFARVGAMVMALPGIGDRTVPPRVRLVLALALSLILYPLVGSQFSGLPQSLPAMLSSLASEVLIGLALGLSVRLILGALHMAGYVIASQTGLAFAQNVDPAHGSQSSLVATFLSVLSVVLIFAADLHLLLLAAIHDSYSLFPPGAALPVGDFAELAFTTMATAFRVAIELAAPFLVFGLVFYTGVGILSRLIPQVQVFFLAIPASILLGFVLLLLCLSTMMLVYLNYFGESLKPYLS